MTTTPSAGSAQVASSPRRDRRIRLERAATIVSREYTDCTTACRSVGLRDIDAIQNLRDLCDARGIPRKHRWGAPPPPQDRKVIYRRVNRWRLKNSDRQKALSAVAAAIANYDLTRGPCERCGSDKNVCADPFSLKPLRVHWRCRSCSAELRRKPIICANCGGAFEGNLVRSFAVSRVAFGIGKRSSDDDESERTNKFEPAPLRQGERVPRWSHQEKARDLDIAGADQSPDQ
jgi:hypothetical protein